MSSVPCFLITPIDRCVVSFRRFTWPPGCPTPKACGAQPTWGCNARVVLGEEPYVDQDNGGRSDIPDATRRTHQRWPATCERCGYAFEPEDAWYEDRRRLFARSDGGLPTTQENAPPGAMWFADWRLDRDPRPEPNTLWCGPDGHCLMVKLPCGSDWCVDGFACNAPLDQRGWTRTGDAPLVTAQPSIATPGYHGFLTAGVLVSC